MNYSSLSHKILSVTALKVALPTIVGASLLGVGVSAAHSQPVMQKPTHSAAVGAQKTHTAQTAPKAVLPVPTPAAAPSPASPPAAAPQPVTAPAPKPQPVVVPSPSSSVSGLKPVQTTPATTPASSSSSPTTQTPPPATTSYASTNWAGYFAANGSFTAVSASWVVPTATGNGSSVSADAAWVGIGGVSTGDLIQIGTDDTVAADGTASYAGFFELLPDGSRVVPGVTITPGDMVTATIAQISSGQWTMSLTDTTNGQSFTTTVSYASSLSSAEWIEEDPSYAKGGLVPFDTFGKIFFTNGSTTQTGISLTIAGSNAQPITLVSSAGQPRATPSALGSDGARFSVSRNGSN